MSLRLCDWKHDKQWVWSITYDEALIDLHRFAIPLHDELNIPGHLEAVAGHLGQVRQIEESSWNGMRQMSGAEMKELIARGWGVGNHSWSHLQIEPNMVDQELRIARDVIEEAIDAPVPLYCAPGSVRNMSEHVLEACEELGYLGAMSIRDNVTRPNQEASLNNLYVEVRDDNYPVFTNPTELGQDERRQLFWLDRSPLIHEFEKPFYNKFDPFRNLLVAQREKAWVIDYCHCPLERSVHINKCVSASELRQRLETVLSEGGSDVWCAVPEEVISYLWCRRAASIDTIDETDHKQHYRVVLSDLPSRVTSRELTFEVDVPAACCNFPQVWVNGTPQPAELVRPRVLRFTIDVGDGVELAFHVPQTQFANS